MAEARIQVPPQVKRGEAFEVKILIRHAMETGYRLTDDGKPIARNVIRLITCRYNGVEVFRAEPSSGIAANPLFTFYVTARAPKLVSSPRVLRSDAQPHTDLAGLRLA